MDNTTISVLLAISQISATLTGLSFLALSYHFKPNKLKLIVNSPMTTIFANIFLPTYFSLQVVISPEYINIITYFQSITFLILSIITTVLTKEREFWHFFIPLPSIIPIIYVLLSGITAHLLVESLMLQIFLSSFQLWIVFRKM